ncbi:hypothetical protein Henu3_gp52 [Mycobacterium phage Henu3]|uniref:Uncharacterized protein n=1 Tax=Mycobacterium phage Henu3 TaxID=2492961 RepID=A0A410T857_9CAUD|nr:hypothetical protein I5G68_gp49 [Mycobacterium phage Henu3]QAU04995.1 hypothetical protein Henu3_gp52 [Mycobacterium phage Henu3]
MAAIPRDAVRAVDRAVVGAPLALVGHVIADHDLALKAHISHVDAARILTPGGRVVLVVGAVSQRRPARRVVAPGRVGRRQHRVGLDRLRDHLLATLDALPRLVVDPAMLAARVIHRPILPRSRSASHDAA